MADEFSPPPYDFSRPEAIMADFRERSPNTHRMLSLTKPQLEVIARALRCPCSVEPDTHLLGRVETAIASFKEVGA